MKYWTILLMSLLLLSSSCNKEEDSGCDNCLGAFRCDINGKEWKPDCDSGTILWGCSAIDCQYYNDSKALDIRVVSEDGNDRLRFSCNGMRIGQNNLYYLGREYIDYNQGNCGGYDLISSNPNSIFIEEIDTVNQTIKGTFHFEGIGHCGDSVKVDNGYFYLGYRF